MFSLPAEKKWQIYCSKKKVSSSRGSLGQLKVSSRQHEGLPSKGTRQDAVTSRVARIVGNVVSIRPLKFSRAISNDMAGRIWPAGLEFDTPDYCWNCCLWRAGAFNSSYLYFRRQTRLKEQPAGPITTSTSSGVCPR